MVFSFRAEYSLNENYFSETCRCDGPTSGGSGCRSLVGCLVCIDQLTATSDSCPKCRDSSFSVMFCKTAVGEVVNVLRDTISHEVIICFGFIRFFFIYLFIVRILLLITCYVFYAHSSFFFLCMVVCSSDCFFLSSCN